MQASLANLEMRDTFSSCATSQQAVRRLHCRRHKTFKVFSNLSHVFGADAFGEYITLAAADI